MNKLRARFSRGEEVKYISHLDTMRTFERTVRRAGIPIAYSQGFNPRPQISFGLPLAVGVTSEAEYVDFEMEYDIRAEQLVERLNNNLPKGFFVQDAQYINTSESLMASVKRASYRVTAVTEESTDIYKVEKCLNHVMNQDNILVEKESKGKVKLVDIKPYIYEVTVLESDGQKFVFNMLMSAGSEFNVKSEMIIKALNETGLLNLKPARIHRTGLFGENGKTLFGA